jgi:L-seryl-tRNA(Ser) seleniumtransferase
MTMTLSPKSKHSANRRTFLGTLGAAFGSLAIPRRLLGAVRSRPGAALAPNCNQVTSGLGATGNVYEELGVTTVINGQGTMTTLGGSLGRPEVEAIMTQAMRNFVSIPELEAAAGKRIAQMLKLPGGYSAIVTSGAAAAMQSGLSGILTRDNEKFIRQLPDLTGMKTEVIIQKSHRNPFDHQLRATGIKLVEIESREDLEKAIGPATAMMHFSNFANSLGEIKVDEWQKLGAAANIPTFLDAAADTPPVSHLWDYANMGYDLIAFSGGKAMRGPQCSGLLLGKSDLVQFALLNNSPYEDVLGRGQKVGKEEIVGMVKALELYLAEDHEALNREWQNRLDNISAKITKVNGVSTQMMVPEMANHVPTMIITWDQKKIAITPADAARQLRKGKPSIVVAHGEDGPGLSMTSFMLQPGEDEVIASKLLELLRSQSA